MQTAKIAAVIFCASILLLHSGCSKSTNTTATNEQPSPDGTGSDTTPAAVTPEQEPEPKVDPVVAEATLAYWESVQKNVDHFHETLADGLRIKGGKSGIDNNPEALHKILSRYASKLGELRDATIALPLKDVDPLAVEHVTKRLAIVSDAVANAQVQMNIVKDIGAIKDKRESFTALAGGLIEAAFNGGESKSYQNLADSGNELLIKHRDKQSELITLSSDESQLMAAEASVRAKLSVKHEQQFGLIPNVLPKD